MKCSVIWNVVLLYGMWCYYMECSVVISNVVLLYNMECSVIWNVVLLYGMWCYMECSVIWNVVLLYGR